MYLERDCIALHSCVFVYLNISKCRKGTIEKFAKVVCGLGVIKYTVFQGFPLEILIEYV